MLHLGRLLEVGPPQELYLRPRTEFVATFLGGANLMVGESTTGGVRVGPVALPLAVGAEEPRRVQVLFRPEDVAVRQTREEISHPVLGQGVVESSTFVGSFERLRLRLPTLPGVRAISPPPPFGGDYLLVDATRSQHQSRRFPLRPGDSAWIGVRRVHALAHPGLSFLLLTDGSPAADAVLSVGGEIARQAHARVTLVGHGLPDAAAEHWVQAARERLGAGLAALESQATPAPAAEAIADAALVRAYDLVVAALPSKDGVELAESALAAGDHHLLLVSKPGPVPQRLLICVAVGEPGKADVGFAGRLARHLGAAARILTVLPDGGGAGTDRELAERFLAASARTLGRMGVPASTALRRGAVREEIDAELAEGGHDLLVLGAPLPDAGGGFDLSGLVGRLIREAERPVLMVRAAEVRR